MNTNRTDDLEIFLATNLTEEEQEKIADPPLNLYLSPHQLLRPSARKQKPLSRFLLFRRNYAAQFPLHNRPNYKNITKGAAENWKKTSARERDLFSTLAQIMRRYVEQNRKYSPHHIVVLVHIVCLTGNFI